MRNKSRQSDQKVDKSLENYVNDDRKVFALSIRDGKVVFSGNKLFLDYVLSENMKTLTLENVMTKMLQDQEDNTFASEVIPVFPLLKYKFKGKDWTFKVAYDYLKITMNILGFFNGSKKTYGDPSDKPEAWPDCLSWPDFKHPCATSLPKMNTIIEHVLAFYGTDVYNHMIQDHSAATEVDPVPAAVTEVESAQAQPPPAEDQPGDPARPLDRTENQDPSFPILPSTSRNNNNNNVVLQDEDVEESEDDREDGELGTDDSEPDSVSDKIGNEDTGNNNEAEEEETSDIGRQYLAIRAGNIAERQQLLKQMFPDKEAVNIQKPRKKKQKTDPQPKKVTYSLRKDPRRNQKYIE